jgi:zinc protease
MTSMKRFLPVIALAAAAVCQAMDVVALPSKSPLITFRFVFRTGAANDPAGKFGSAALTAGMITQGGTKSRTYKQVVEAMYPMATSLSSQVDKEMTAFMGTTHVENLEAFYGLIREMMLEPGWRAEDFDRVREDQINYLRTTLRGNNDEELGKEVLYEQIYAGHPYGHVNEGKVSDLQSTTIDDLKKFYVTNFTQANLTIGLAGGYPEGFAARVRKDFSKLPAGSPPGKIAPPKPIESTRFVFIDKPTRSVAYSIGHPIDVRRGHPDYAALLVAQAYLGYHRNSWGQLFQRIREVRGMNYGDYAYIEYFPRGMFQFEPDPNLGRQHQIFQIWIRPVEQPTAHFALRLALFEFEKFVTKGITKEGFENTRNFLSKNVNLLLKTKNAELGYLIDSKYYGIPEYDKYLKSALAKLTVDDVNRAIEKHLHTDDLIVVAVGPNMEAFRAKLVAGEPSPMTYNSPKPDDVVEEDKIVQAYKLPITAKNVKVIPVNTVFE